MSATALYNDITNAAKQHGENDPGHEVANLQDCLGEALKLLDATQLRTLHEALKERELI
jgi:hypothetical protein